MNRARQWTLAVALATGSMIAPACSKEPAADAHADHEAPAAASHRGGDEGDESAHLPLDHLVGVAFEVVGEPVEEGAWHAGEAMADETARLALSAPVEGVIVALSAVPGREVGPGAPLVEIRSPELARLKASWLTARARSERARADLAREERLFAAQAGARRDLEAVSAEVAVAAAEEEAARLEVSARGAEVGTAGASLVLRAPRRGRVAEWSVLAGQGVQAGERLGVFDAGRAALVRIELPLPGAPGWNDGTTTRVRRSDGVEWSARVEGAPVSLSPETRRMAYRLRLVGAGTDLPIAGTPLEVRVPLPAGVVVPQAAVQQIEGSWGVFVAVGEEAAFRPVRRGPELGGDVIILEGLVPGERVATAGAYLLKALYLKRAGGEEGHAH